MCKSIFVFIRHLFNLLHAFLTLQLLFAHFLHATKRSFCALVTKGIVFTYEKRTSDEKCEIDAIAYSLYQRLACSIAIELVAGSSDQPHNLRRKFAFTYLYHKVIFSRVLSCTIKRITLSSGDVIAKGDKIFFTVHVSTRENSRLQFYYRPRHFTCF